MKEFHFGLDICNEYTQLSFFNEEKNEPESIYQLNTADTYMLPNVLFYSEENEEWYVGSQVAEHRFIEQGIMIEDIVHHLTGKEQRLIGEKAYTYEDLLILVLKGHLMEFLNRFEDIHVKSLTVTIQEYQKELFEALLRLGQELELSDNDFHIISHTETFVQYVLHQASEIYNNSVALFDYNVSGMHYYRMDIERKGTQRFITVEYKDLSKDMRYSLVYGEPVIIDEKFSILAEKLMKEKFISAVFLTGTGFADKWMKKSTSILCGGRKVFLGQNIYSKGACYHAKVDLRSEFTLDAEENIIFDIGIQIGDERHQKCHPIATGGTQWYNMKGKIFVFMDNTNRLELIYKDRMTGDHVKEIIEVQGLPKRPSKTTKLSLEVEMYSKNHGAVVIRDEGFGKLYPTTNKIYRKEFSIGS